MAADQEGIGRNQSECKGASVKFWQMEFSPQAREEAPMASGSGRRWVRGIRGSSAPVKRSPRNLVRSQICTVGSSAECRAGWTELTDPLRVRRGCRPGAPPEHHLRRKLDNSRRGEPRPAKPCRPVRPLTPWGVPAAGGACIPAGNVSRAPSRKKLKSMI